MSSDCAFCEIVAGVQPAAVVVDEPSVLAFLDRRPVFRGHALVVPKRHVATFADLPADLMPPVLEVAQRISRAMPAALQAQGTFVAMNNVVSQSVPHVHVHVVPRSKGDGLRGFFWPRERYESEAEKLDYAHRLREALA